MVIDAQTSYTVAGDDGGVVSEAFGSVESAGITFEEKNQVSEEINRRLRELGYLR